MLRSTILSALLAVALPAQQSPQVTVYNPSHTGTNVWVPVAVPWQEAQAIGETAVFDSDAGVFRAVQGPVQGFQTVFYDVSLAPIRALEQLEGVIRVREPDDPGSSAPPPRFIPSSWVADDVTRLFPSWIARIDGVVYQSPPSEPVLVLETRARQDWRVSVRCGPLVIEYFTTFWHQQDIVEWQCFAAHSDPGNSSMQITVEWLHMVVLGEPVLVEDALVLGIPAPRWEKPNWIVELVSSPTDMGDAQGLPVFRGAILATDNTQNREWYYNLATPDLSTRNRVSRLLGRGAGRPMSWTDWVGRWLAFQATVPERPSDAGEIAARLDAQRAPMLSTQDLFLPRAIGLRPNAGSTGDQEDFGASKGSGYLLGEIWFAETLPYQVGGKAVRPFHYRELDGTPVTQAGGHPDWWTWSQQTHWHCDVSPDRLGKPCPVPSHGTHGWTGEDDQHTSWRNHDWLLAAYDMPAYRALMRDGINVSLANIRFHESNGAGAPRAIGRRMLNDANRWLLTGREDVWNRLVVDHGEKAREFSFAPFSGFRLQGGPVADDRVLVDGDGQTVPAIVVWQEGLCMTGLAAGWAAHRYRERLGLPADPGIQAVGDQLVEIASTVVRHYLQPGVDGWQFYLNVAWDGAAPDPAVIASPDDIVGVVRDRQLLGSAWFDWLGPGLRYLRMADHGLDVPIDVQVRLQEIFSQWESDVWPTADLRRREWFAVVDPSAPPPPPINRPPQAEIEGPNEMAAGSQQAYRVVAVDPDGDPMVFSWDTLGQGTDEILVRGGSAGDELTITVTVSDGKAETTVSKKVVVR